MKRQRKRTDLEKLLLILVFLVSGCASIAMAWLLYVALWAISGEPPK